MSKDYKRVVATLSNGKSIYTYNMDKSAELPASVVVSGLPETVVSTSGSEQYKFSNPSSGWFCSISADDAERMPAVVQFPSGDIGVELKPLVSYTSKDLASAKPFAGGAK